MRKLALCLVLVLGACSAPVGTPASKVSEGSPMGVVHAYIHGFGEENWEQVCENIDPVTREALNGQDGCETMIASAYKKSSSATELFTQFRGEETYEEDISGDTATVTIHQGTKQATIDTARFDGRWYVIGGLGE